MSSALIVQGGWQGHEPKQVSEILARWLRESGFEAEVSDTLDSFKEAERLRALDLIVPVWTMGKITSEQLGPLLTAVEGGVGIAGLHGGMGDAFRDATDYQFMVGGQWVAHPGGAEVIYSVNMTDVPSPITEGVSDFQVTSEQYYMHVDPVNSVLATTTFAVNGTVMPAVWTKMHGEGRVFYCSVGHVARDLEIPEMRTLMTRGMLWAARKL